MYGMYGTVRFVQCVRCIWYVQFGCNLKIFEYHYVAILAYTNTIRWHLKIFEYHWVAC